MEIYRLPARSDNYIFVLHDPTDNTAAVVDPADAPPVLQKLDELGATLTTIFNTHHHNDHVGGNRELLERFPEAEVYGGAQDQGRIPGQRHFLGEGDRRSRLPIALDKSSLSPVIPEAILPITFHLSLLANLLLMNRAICSVETRCLRAAAVDCLKEHRLRWRLL